MAILSLWAIDNSKFLKTVDEQLEQGYEWNKIECREVNPSLPAITIDSPNGKKIICYTLVKF